MFVTLFLVFLLMIALAVVVSAKWPVEKMSRFELTRLSSHSHKMKTRLELSELVSTFRVVKLIKIILLVILIASILFVKFGWLGALYACVISFISVFIARFLSGRWFVRLVKRHADFFIKVYGKCTWFAPKNVSRVDPEIHSREEFEMLARNSTAVFPPTRLKSIQHLLVLDKKTVADIMTPVADIVSVDANESLGPLLIDDLHKTGHRMFPVIRDDFDVVAGTLFLDDVIPLKQKNQTARGAMRPKLPLIEASSDLLILARRFNEYHSTAFLVVDESEKVIGLVTLDDFFRALALTDGK